MKLVKWVITPITAPAEKISNDNQQNLKDEIDNVQFQ